MNPRSNNKDWLCHIFAAITVILWSSAYTLTPYALTYYTPSAMSLFRFFFASIVLVTVAIIKKIGLPKLRDLPKFFLAGALGITLYMICYNTGAQYISGTTVSVTLATKPIFTAILARILFKERIRALGWAAIALGFGGILILTLWNGIFSINQGIFLVLISALLFSGYNITQREYGKKYTPLAVSIYSMLAGALMLLIFLPETLAQVASAPLEITLLVAYLGTFPSAFAFILWTYALSMASKTTLVSNYMFTTPFLSMLLGLLFTGTLPDISTYVGGAVIIISLVLFRLFNRPSQTPSRLQEANKRSD